MLNIKTINNKDYIAYDEFVLDLTTNKWINVDEFEEQLNSYEIQNDFRRLNERVQAGQ
jgi:hypothetical protein